MRSKNIVNLKFFIPLLLFTINLNSQADFGGWSSFQLKHTIDNGDKISLKPILRTRANFSQYQDLFLDLDYRRNLPEGFWINIRNRGILAPDSKYNHWIFFDVGKVNKINEAWSLSNQFRYHWGLPVNGFNDIDLIRWLPQIKYKFSDKLSAALSWEAHYKLDSDSGYWRSRYSAGASMKLYKNLGLHLALWLDDFSEFSGARDIFLLVSNFNYTIQ